MIAGFGFRSSATAESLGDALHRAGPSQVVAIATAEDKARAPAFAAFARALELPVVAIDSATLTAQETATQSEASRAARGSGSLAEAAALAAAGPGARLVAPRVVSADRLATCALALPADKGERA